MATAREIDRRAFVKLLAAAGVAATVPLDWRRYPHEPGVIWVRSSFDESEWLADSCTLESTGDAKNMVELTLRGADGKSLTATLNTTHPDVAEALRVLGKEV